METTRIVYVSTKGVLERLAHMIVRTLVGQPVFTASSSIQATNLVATSGLRSDSISVNGQPIQTVIDNTTPRIFCAGYTDREATDRLSICTFSGTRLSGVDDINLSDGYTPFISPGGNIISPLYVFYTSTNWGSTVSISGDTYNMTIPSDGTYKFHVRVGVAGNGLSSASNTMFSVTIGSTVRAFTTSKDLVNGSSTFVGNYTLNFISECTNGEIVSMKWNGSSGTGTVVTSGISLDLIDFSIERIGNAVASNIG